jgi:hypothetical protein
VTDLVGLDWCETKFLYTLEGGKKRKTDGTTNPLRRLSIAMRQGHKIHKELENELHETFTMTQITTAEEMWALRFLNIHFGLQELRLHGMTVLLALGETHSRESSPFLDLSASTS